MSSAESRSLLWLLEIPGEQKEVCVYGMDGKYREGNG